MSTIKGTRPIDSEVAYQFLTDQLAEETGAFSKGVNKGLNIARSAMRNPDAIPTLTSPSEWISVSDKLPEEKEYVLIAMHDMIEVARIEKGISQEERRKMKSGEIPDAEEFGYEPGKPPFVVKRSDSIKAADQEGNNLVPYIWRARSGPMEWFGQYVTHWMSLPEPPKKGKEELKDA